MKFPRKRAQIQICMIQSELSRKVKNVEIKSSTDNKLPRGGYSTPQIFEITEDIDYFYIAQRDLTARCGDLSWYSDNCGYRWYASNDEPKLEDIAVVYDGHLFNKITGEPFEFSCMVGGTQKEVAAIPELNRLKRFVQENYGKHLNMIKAVKQEFQELCELITVDDMVTSYMKEIDDQTLKPEL